MSCTTMPLKFSIELWAKSVVTYNNSGQPVTEWVLEKIMSCDFMPSRAEERLVGRQQNPVSYNVWLHGDEPVDVHKQLRALKDASGNVIETGPFNIIGVRAHAGWSTISHYTVNAQKVLD